MKSMLYTLYLSIGLAIILSSSLWAQPARDSSEQASISPEKLLGKSFVECERLLGKPTVIAEATKHWRPILKRTYASSIPGVDSIILISQAWGGPWKKAGPPSHVTQVIYDLAIEPKCTRFENREKPDHEVITLESQFTKVGINIDRFKGFPNGVQNSTVIHPSWGYATSDGGAVYGVYFTLDSDIGEIGVRWQSIEGLKSDDRSSIREAEGLKKNPGGADEHATAVANYVQSQKRDSAEIWFFIPRALDDRLTNAAP